jgi:hypothetical protein
MSGALKAPENVERAGISFLTSEANFQTVQITGQSDMLNLEDDQVAEKSFRKRDAPDLATKRLMERDTKT